MSEQARLVVREEFIGARLAVTCVHGRVSGFSDSLAPTALHQSARWMIRQYDETQRQRPDCHCSTAELWARYGERPEKEEE